MERVGVVRPQLSLSVRDAATTPTLFESQGPGAPGFAPPETPPSHAWPSRGDTYISIRPVWILPTYTSFIIHTHTHTHIHAHAHTHRHTGVGPHPYLPCEHKPIATTGLISVTPICYVEGHRFPLTSLSRVLGCERKVLCDDNGSRPTRNSDRIGNQGTREPTYIIKPTKVG